MGRLARALRWRGEGLSALLLGLAVERALQARQFVGGYALIVEAKGEEAKNFYRLYGLRPYLDTPNSLYLPLGGQGKTTRAWLASTGRQGRGRTVQPHARTTTVIRLGRPSPRRCPG